MTVASARFHAMIPALVAAAASFVAPARGDARPHGGLLRYPDVSRTHVVFVYANDLWLVARGGRVAEPLASPPGEENFPRFSADGQTSAFVGN